MLKRKQIRAIQKTFYKLFKKLWKLTLSVGEGIIHWLLRTFLIAGRSQGRYASAKAGFVLPTVALLLLVVALVVAAILFRTGSRTNQVIGAREEQVIYNAATPAIERAKAKLEYLFLKDYRKPSGVPSESYLLSMLLNDGQVAPKLTGDNPYTLPGETRLNIDGESGEDPAWYYQVDIDKDGKLETVVYSILLKKRNSDGSVTLETTTDELKKAKALVIRNGPLTTAGASDNTCANVGQRSANEGDWDKVSSVNTSMLRKTFQVDAIVISSKGGTRRTVATLEFQQDRQVDKGNKWGAWFRYDLEIFPGGDNAFRWNGAMYTAGNLIVGDKNFTAYLISSPGSCVYTKDGSEITIYKDGEKGFQGQLLAAKLGSSDWSENSHFHAYKSKDNYAVLSYQTGDTETKLLKSTDSVKDDLTIPDATLDPIALFTEDINKPRGGGNNRDKRDPLWDTKNAPEGKPGYFQSSGRIYNKQEQPPYVDDTYRADDRYGPKPKYGDTPISDGGKNIPSSETKLVNNSAPANDEDFKTLGLDGYWERRAWANGLRVIVGQRLELGNPFGWNKADLSARDPKKDDPLYPPNATVSGRAHEQRQRRTWRDNLAAVQGTVVYHAAYSGSIAGKSKGDAPIACLATTAHPGTLKTISDSKDFKLPGDWYYQYDSERLYTDFLTGKGTNGWEFQAPDVSNSNVQTALKNLAEYAGDPDGAFPPKQEAGKVHPNPIIDNSTLKGTMWGDFSNLRRSFSGNNSIADKSYQDSAACTLGMLAYNINYFDKFDYSSKTTELGNLETALRKLSDGDKANGEFDRTDGKVYLPGDTTADATIPDISASAPVPPEVYINTYKNPSTGANETLLTGDNLKLARLVIVKQQIARDREFSISPIPTPTDTTFDHDNDANTAEKDLKKLGCDPNATFTVSGISGSLTTGPRALGVLCPVDPKFPVLGAIFPKSGGPNLSSVALQPIKNPSDWKLPRTSTIDTSQKQNIITKPDNNKEAVALLDTGFFNGRELTTVRTLDIDLNLLRQNDLKDSSPKDTWLPKSGVVYAFREDAVREDAIARPASGGVTGQTDVTDPNNPKDPDLVSVNNISPKPVDYIADPDRRPYGFRLRNGKDLRKSPEGKLDKDNPRGITFVSDNPVYIQGNFNLHVVDGGSEKIEEFKSADYLKSDWSNFYDRKRSNLDTRFARVGSNQDAWRPAEVLADAITILSDKFVEGSIDLGIRNDNTNRPDLTPDGRYSFRSMNGPDKGNNYNGPGDGWLRENGYVDNSTTPGNYPIKISPNGHPMYCESNGAEATTRLCPVNKQKEYYVDGGDDYRKIGNKDYRSDINLAKETTINSIIVSGIVPSRKFQSYGGFHNFPRFIESWQGIPLNLFGSFVQLNFSTYATAPFELQAWEKGQTPTDIGSNLNPVYYYQAPQRNWGYDVGLQYAPAGPIAQRFVTSGIPRSEFYRDLKADDPYICRLRLALNGTPYEDKNANKECDK